MFGSSWGNQNQQQQQPQQPSGFGSFSGGTSAFGSGQQQQQPQQPANAMFGGLAGAAAPNPGGSAFGGGGAFGTPSNAGTSAFGAKPAGFGAFSGAATNTFGSAPAAPSAFGQPANPGGSAFGGGGGGGSIFGQSKPATTGFGAAVATNDPVTTGTSNPPYSVTRDKDGTADQYQSISCMPAYQGTSLEELRVQDYAQGRKTAPAGGASAFGAATTGGGIFGQTGGNINTFGGGGAFGQQPPAQPQNAFGGGSTFGGGGTFGAPQQAQAQPQATGLFGGGGNAFGKTSTFGSGGSAFGGGGAPALGGGTSAFGQQQQAPAAQGLFGQPQQQPAAGAFGGGGAFGQPAKPATAFGQPGTATALGGGGLFPQNNQQQQAPQAQAGGLFGGNAPVGGSLFPQQGQQQPSTGLFGQPAPAAGNNLFGGGASTTGGGLFGAQPQQQQQQQGGSAFGAAGGGGLFNTQNKPPGGGLFGGGGGGTFGQTNQQQGAQQPNALGGGLFGSAPNNNNQQQPQQQQGGGLFGGGALGAKPAGQPGGGLFGGGSTLFGSNNQNQPNQAGTTAGGLFGSNNAGGGFGQSTLGAPQAGQGLFGASQLGQSQQQPQLTASIAQPVSSNIPIFAMLPPGPKSFEQAPEPKRKSNYLLEIPTRAPVPRMQLNYNPPASGKLRGFGSSSNGSSMMLSTNGGGMFGSKSQNNLLDFNRESTPERTLNSSSLGSSMSRSSVKKLILDKKIDPNELFVRNGSASPSPSLRGSPSTNGKVIFSPAMSAAAREREEAANAAAAAATPLSPPPLPAASKLKAPNKFTAASVPPEDKSEDQLALGDYWVVPKLKNLKQLGYSELSSFKGLFVGRIGYGEILFLDPVDLSGLARLSNLLGEDIRFDNQECAVYPEADEVNKPSPGHGLNVRAEIKLLNCWALDKATRDPIRDPEDERAKKHLRKLQKMKGTEFVSFKVEDGEWCFRVDHF